MFAIILFMNRTSFALFVALLIHVVLFLSLYMLFTSLHIQKKEPLKKENKIKISLKEMPKVKQKSGTIKKIVKKTIPMPVPKGEQLKKDLKPKPKPEPKKIVKKVVQKKEVIKKPILKKKTSPKKPKPEKIKPIKKQDPLAWLHQDVSQQENKKTKETLNHQNNISQDIRKLYGEKFSQLTKGQQKYLLDNQEIMRRITQRVLNRVASTSSALQQLHVQSVNTIEFYLYPNGDISDIKFLSKSGYFELDETTKETIEYAYSKYPRPTEKTLIRYRVFYDLR